MLYSVCSKMALVSLKHIKWKCKMILDKEQILGAAKKHYGNGSYGKQSYGLSEACVDLSQEWLDHHYFGRMSAGDTRKELRRYIRKNVDYKAHNATFIPTFVWVWLAQTIISWITKKIVEYIINNR